MELMSISISLGLIVLMLFLIWLTMIEMIGKMK